MNSFVRTFALVIGAAVSALAVTAVQAQSLPNSAPGNGANNNPYNSPLHRANPNSRQGTQPITPPGRTPVVPPVRQAPTLENGGIRNGYPAREAPRQLPNQIAPPPHSNSR